MRHANKLTLSLVLSAALLGCNLGGSGSTRGATTVALSGTVSIPVSASVSSGVQGLGVVGKVKPKFVEETASAGIVTIMNSEGQTLDVVAVHSDGTYTTSLPASDVQGETLLVVYENELNKSEPEIHSYDAIPASATSATIDCNTKTDFSTAVFLAVAEKQTGEPFEVGDDLSGALAVVVPDAIKETVESVVGDSTISESTSVDTADTGLEAAYEAHQDYIAQGGALSASGGQPTPPVEVLKDAIEGDGSAIAAINTIAPTVGGGIPIDTTVYTTALQAMDTIFQAYANQGDADVVADWETIKASSGTINLKAYIGPIVETPKGDLAGLKPIDFRQCTKYIAAMDSSVAKAFGTDSKARAAIIEQVKIGACDDADEAKFVMGALGGSIPEQKADGTYDFTNFVPATVAQAAHTVGLDLKNKIDPSQYATYGVGDLATSFAPQMRDTNVIQTCALTGIAGCSGLVSGIINNPVGTVLDSSYVTIPKPPGASCSSGSCATGGTCTAQSDGSMRCAALSSKLGLACETGSDCDDVTFCNLGKVCILTAGATTGMGAYGAGGVQTTYGGTGTGAPVVTSSGSAGGACSAGACQTGSTCQAGVCVASTSTITYGSGYSCTSTGCGPGLTCTNGTCQGSSSGSGTGSGGLHANGESCAGNTQCGSSCCSAGVCAVTTSCSAPTTTTTGTTTTTTGSTTTTTATTCTTGCAVGTSCTVDAICSSGFCGNRALGTSPGTCANPATASAGQYCLVSTNCTSGLSCNSNLCASQSGPSCSGADVTCTVGSQCCSGYCGGFSHYRVCKATGSGLPGHFCSTPGDCQIGYTCITATMSCGIQ